MKNEEILEKLATRTIGYLKNDIGIDIDDNYESIQCVDQIEYLDITTHIALSADMRGTVGMSISNKLACTMVENFLHEEIPANEKEELAAENVAETLNITLGNILKDLTVMKNGGSVNISTPYTICNSVIIKKKKNGMMYICKLKSNTEEILLSYFI